MKKKYIVLIVILTLIIVIAGIFIYERLHASLYVNEEPIVIEMSMYGGFEQVGSIGRNLTRNDKQTTTTPGDLVLYNGNQLVVFYGSNSWSYTRLGKIQNLSEAELEELLSNGDVTIIITR